MIKSILYPIDYEKYKKPSIPTVLQYGDGLYDLRFLESMEQYRDHTGRFVNYLIFSSGNELNVYFDVAEEELHNAFVSKLKSRFGL